MLPLDPASRQVSISAPYYAFLEALWPHQRVRRIAEALASYRPTLVHALNEGQTWLTRRLSKQLGIPYTVSLLSFDHEPVGFSDRRCGAICPCTGTLARQVRQHHPRLATAVHRVPIGTHVTEEACAFSNAAVRPHIFCSSPLEYGHGLSSLLKAFKRVSTSDPPPHLTLCGRGPAESDLRRQTRQLGLTDHVHFIDPIDEIVWTSDAYKAILASVDIFVRPYVARLWRPDLLEAMSVGCAIVAVEGQLDDLILPDQTALTVPAQNEDALVAALERLLRDPTQARALGHNAQQHVRRHFLASHMITRLVEAYRLTLRAKGRSIH